MDEFFGFIFNKCSLGNIRLIDCDFDTFSGNLTLRQALINEIKRKSLNYI